MTPSAFHEPIVLHYSAHAIVRRPLGRFQLTSEQLLQWTPCCPRVIVDETLGCKSCAQKKQVCFAQSYVRCFPGMCDLSPPHLLCNRTSGPRIFLPRMDRTMAHTLDTWVHLGYTLDAPWTHLGYTWIHLGCLGPWCARPRCNNSLSNLCRAIDKVPIYARMSDVDSFFFLWD